MAIYQYAQHWSEHMSQYNKGTVHKSFKSTFSFKDYFVILPKPIALYIFNDDFTLHDIGNETHYMLVLTLKISNSVYKRSSCHPDVWCL